MNTVEERLARIETKLDALLHRDDDHEVRLRALEQWSWKVRGKVVAISGMVSLAIALGGLLVGAFI